MEVRSSSSRLPAPWLEYARAAALEGTPNPKSTKLGGGAAPYVVGSGPMHVRGQDNGIENIAHRLRENSLQEYLHDNGRIRKHGLDNLSLGIHSRPDFHEKLCQSGLALRGTGVRIWKSVPSARNFNRDMEWEAPRAYSMVSSTGFVSRTWLMKKSC